MSNFPTGDHTQLSWADVYRVARQAGFSPAAAVIATAITMPESGRYPGIQQSGQPYSTTGWGLWQITPGNSEPSIGVNNALLDPLTNARAAFAKYQQAGNSFRPWTTFVDGAYQAYLANAQAAAGTVGNDIGGTVGGAPAAGASAAGQAAAGGGNTLGGSTLGWASAFNGTAQADLGKLNQDPNNQQMTQAFNAMSDMVNQIGQAVQDPSNILTQVPVIGGLLGIASAITSAFGSLGKFFEGLLWLINPLNWVRIILGIIGGIFVVAGGILVSRSA